ncbi:hypothetical protein BJX61DRAFT_102285 [Aspergillus egyptiacus]|nr:hypothetical protein BJX61DRAFT_102285 [Aspergillus egyptiacus]
MNEQGFSMDSFPVLEGVPPREETSIPTYEGIESPDTTDDTSSEDGPSTEHVEDASQQYGTVRPVVTPYSHPRRRLRNYECYHSTVSRQWRIDQYETCDSCGRRPFFGWFYICTEDTDGYSDPIDPDASLLSPWITEAILAGEYTEEQKEILIQQKLGVLRICERERQLAQSQARADAASFGLNSQTQPHRVRCTYRACYHCDRKLQERTWLSLNEICNDPNVKPPNAWDLSEIPIADARHVINLGTRSSPPPPPVPPPHLFLPHLSHSELVSLRRSMRRVSGTLIFTHESSVSLHSVMSSLSTIEEEDEEDMGGIELSPTDSRLRNEDMTEAATPSAVSDKDLERLQYPEEDEESDDSLYS